MKIQNQNLFLISFALLLNIKTFCVWCFSSERERDRELILILILTDLLVFIAHAISFYHNKFFSSSFFTPPSSIMFGWFVAILSSIFVLLSTAWLSTQQILIDQFWLINSNVWSELFMKCITSNLKKIVQTSSKFHWNIYFPFIKFESKWEK